MGNVFRYRKEFNRPRYYDVASATVVETGDLLWYDAATKQLKPAADLTFGASLAATQRSFAAAFAGVSSDRSQNGETKQTQSNTCGVHEFDCASATFEQGDLVGIDDNAGGTALENQKVIKVTQPELAIGRVAKPYTTATTKVEIEIYPRTQSRPDEAIKPVKNVKHTITAADASNNLVDFDTGWGAAPEGAIHVNVRSSAGVEKAHDSVVTTLTGGGNDGKVRVADGATYQLTATDVLHLTIYRYADIT